jgi:hypothetical protein
MQTTPDSRSKSAGDLVPAAVRQLLAKGEEIETRYEMKRSEVYATATRLIILRDGQTTSHDYQKIAGVRDIARSNVWLILCGVGLFALGGTNAVFPVAGGALILLGILTKAHRVELLVTGLREPVVLDGAREVLGPLAHRLAEKGVRKLST